MSLPLTSRQKACFEQDVALRHDVSDSDIHFSRLSGMHPEDIDVLCDFSHEEGLFIAIRCPKRPARHFHGKFPPKPAEVKQKSDPRTGLVTLNQEIPGVKGKVFVSDYDLMCIWRFLGSGYEKIDVSAPDPRQPRILLPEAQAVFDKLKDRLRSDLQHGAQDNYRSEKNPGVAMKTTRSQDRNTGRNVDKPVDRFMVFHLGKASYACKGAELKTLYDKVLGPGHWPYDADGNHLSTSRYAGGKT